ncbi:GNAT superfamily N-acetyltransferase [Actimicrobium sp. GrIS 1.19]|uniref:GNAT family N-acetyltransferase n=1 Tax=Actimicrobium sp. GrIS 1.19 TaxID=3071708 RepID=UPI002E04F67A|nr:GNAT superfamily N-acetyltransferase [Actimicrobium sp. GrIS 1.19]
MTFQIQTATADDHGRLAALIEISARALSAGYYSPAQTEGAIAQVFGVDSQLIVDGTMYLAREHGQLIGCGAWSARQTLYGGDQVAGRLDRRLDPATDAARIRAFFVHPAHARRGIGRALLAACEQAAMAAGYCRAELVGTLPGVPLYTALGYIAVAPVEIDLGQGLTLPCQKMVKQLG